MKSATMITVDLSSAPERSASETEAGLSGADLARLDRQLDAYAAFWAEAREETPGAEAQDLIPGRPSPPAG
jgi:hypothetical protein